MTRVMRIQIKGFIFGMFLMALLLAIPRDGHPAGDYEVTVNPSRTEGVAPLSVFFDATQTPELADGSYVDATFAWNFDVDNVDPNANYRKAGGFVAAHVFETPGTYKVRVDIYDVLGRQAYEEVTITVLPFSGQTFYVASDGSDTNTGTTMDDPVQTVSRALLELASANTRILFRKGDTFNTTYVGASGRPGPVIIAGYEDPDSPSTEAPIIYNTSVDGDWATIDLGNDWRIMDLSVRTGGNTAGEEGPRYPGGVGFSNDSEHSLIYRVEQSYLSSGWMSPYGRYNTVAECNIHDVVGTGFTSGSDGGALIGNWVHDKGVEDPEHIYRLQGGSRSFIAFNNFEANVINFDNLTIRGNTEKVVIYKNILDRATTIRPQNTNSAEEYQHHCLVDSNLFIGRDNPPGYITTTPIRQVALSMRAKDIVIRNNIIYNYQFGIVIGDDSVVGPSQRIKIYNNTYINMTPDSSFYFVSVDEGCSDIEVMNNLILDSAGGNVSQSRIIDIRPGGGGILSAISSSNRNLFFGDNWDENTGLFSANTLAEWRTATGNDMNSMLQAPNLASLDMESVNNFSRPLENSPAVDSGEFTAAALDFNGDLRDLSRDIGAVEYLSDLVDTESPSAPSSLAASAVSASRIDLSWSASTDNVEVVGYRIYRDGDQVGAIVGTAYSDTGCDQATQYVYTVRAYDAAGNVSSPSNEATVTTGGQGTTPDQNGDDATGSGGGGGCFLSVLADVNHR